MQNPIVFAVICCATLLAHQPQAKAQPSEFAADATALVSADAAQRMEAERSRLQTQRLLPSSVAARRIVAQRQKTIGKWMLGFGIENLVAGLAVTGPDMYVLTHCSRHGSCFYDTGPVFTMLGMPFAVLGGFLTLVGAPLYAVGNSTLKSLPPATGLGEQSLVSERSHLSDAEVLASVRVSMRTHRVQMIVSGVVMGVGAAMSAGNILGIAINPRSDYVTAETIMAIMGGTAMAAAVPPFAYFASRYTHEKALLNGYSNAPAPEVSLAPVIGGDHCGLSLSGNF